MKLRTWVILLGSAALARRMARRTTKRTRGAISRGTARVRRAIPTRG